MLQLTVKSCTHYTFSIYCIMLINSEKIVFTLRVLQKALSLRLYFLKAIFNRESKVSAHILCFVYEISECWWHGL